MSHNACYPASGSSSNSGGSSGSSGSSGSGGSPTNIPTDLPHPDRKQQRASQDDCGSAYNNEKQRALDGSFMPSPPPVSVDWSRATGAAPDSLSTRLAALPRRAQLALLTTSIIIVMSASSALLSYLPSAVALFASGLPFTHSGINSTSWARLTSHYRGPPVCDPFRKPGFVSFDKKHANDAAWVPFGPSCPPAPDYLGALRVIRDIPLDAADKVRVASIRRPRRNRKNGKGLGGHGRIRDGVDAWGRPYPDLTFLIGKTALLLGDSVDRNFLEQIHELVGARVRGMDYKNVSAGVPKGWDGRGVPWLINFGLKAIGRDPWDGGGWMDGMVEGNLPGGEFAGLNFGLVNGFLYGMDDIDEFSAQADWHPPGLAETRISSLVVPMIQSLATKYHEGEGPAFIMLSSGLWDLAFFGRRDRHADKSPNVPLNDEQLDWWINRMRSVIWMLKGNFPNTPIWLRKMHRVGDQFWASHDWSPKLEHGMGEGFVNFFSDVRIHQLREMQEHVARLEGIPIWDFGHMWEGFQAHQDKVHPKRDPGGTLAGQSILHHMWMESVGREHWDEDARRYVGPLPHPLR